MRGLRGAATKPAVRTGRVSARGRGSAAGRSCSLLGAVGEPGSAGGWKRASGGGGWRSVATPSAGARPCFGGGTAATASPSRGGRAPAAAAVGAAAAQPHGLLQRGGAVVGHGGCGLDAVGAGGCLQAAQPCKEPVEERGVVGDEGRERTDHAVGVVDVKAVRVCQHGGLECLDHLLEALPLELAGSVGLALGSGLGAGRVGPLGGAEILPLILPTSPRRARIRLANRPMGILLAPLRARPHTPRLIRVGEEVFLALAGGPCARVEVQIGRPDGGVVGGAGGEGRRRRLLPRQHRRRRPDVEKGVLALHVAHLPIGVLGLIAVAHPCPLPST
mmetsp:Transcript_154752/g.475446  ORF Transcript_154752/g.475446 Transcript_154752/m.475446 type:complete len:332 (-) Transcript_154752:18-1013(-)